MHRTTIERRLSDAHDRLVRARAELAVLDEQLLVVNDIADDTRLRALVSETPLASKEHDEANRHAIVMLHNRAVLAERILELEHRQNELLDRLVVDPGLTVPAFVSDRRPAGRQTPWEDELLPPVYLPGAVPSSNFDREPGRPLSWKDL